MLQGMFLNRSSLTETSSIIGGFGGSISIGYGWELQSFIESLKIYSINKSRY